MKTGDIVFLKRPYKGYRAVELMERLECRWLVRIVESGLERKHSINSPFHSKNVILLL